MGNYFKIRKRDEIFDEIFRTLFFRRRTDFSLHGVEKEEWVSARQGA